MYKLTLNKAERAAFNWIENRYAHGSNMLRIIWGRGKIISPAHVEDIDDPREITFEIPEPDAWAIKQLIDGDGRKPYPWDCFAPELAEKMRRFIDEIV